MENKSRIKVGWIPTDEYVDALRKPWAAASLKWWLFADETIRSGHIGAWLNANSGDIRSELFRPHRRYDVLVFQKSMCSTAAEWACNAKSAGTKLVFDANVNYYEKWGDYFIPGTCPTKEQQLAAEAMTKLADLVIADSTYIGIQAKKINSNVVVIPDNVNPKIFKGLRKHIARTPVRLVWSGIAKKAAHLLLIEDVLAELKNAELLLVCEQEPAVMTVLRKLLPCYYVKYSNRRYARLLLYSDILISPKRLCNAYEHGHSEYKITLGMSAGLPVVASPQLSYKEALDQGGGFIADTLEEWRNCLERLINEPALREEMGVRASSTVKCRYSTDAVGPVYAAALRQLSS